MNCTCTELLREESDARQSVLAEDSEMAQLVDGLILLYHMSAHKQLGKVRTCFFDTFATCHMPVMKFLRIYIFILLVSCYKQNDSVFARFPTGLSYRSFMILHHFVSLMLSTLEYFWSEVLLTRCLSSFVYRCIRWQKLTRSTLQLSRKRRKNCCLVLQRLVWLPASCVWIYWLFFIILIVIIAPYGSISIYNQ